MKKLLIVAVLLLSWRVTTSAVLAQEERAKENETQHEETAFQVIARWANFAVLFGGLAYLLRKPMSDFFRSRSNDIADGLQRAQAEQASARAKMDEIEQRLAHLASDVATLKSEAEHESLADRERIISEAKREVDRVVEQSRQEIERIARTVEREVKESIADQVIDRATTTLRTEMTQDDQKRVIVRFIQRL